MISDNFEVLLDDRDISPGNMFSDSDLIGVPYKIIIGKQFLNSKNFELKLRNVDKSYTISEKNNAENPSVETINKIKEYINI